MNLTEMLELEQNWWPNTGSKEEEIVRRFGISPTRYYQKLNAALNTAAALEAAPLTINRLLRIREGRQIAQTPKR